MLSAIPPANRWGPFALDLDPVEFTARCRTLRAVAHLICGPRGKALCSELEACEAEPWQLSAALVELDLLDALDRRRVLSTYGSLSCPRWRS